MSEKTNTPRYKEWLFVAYPENVEYRELIQNLQSLGVDGFVSPLHSPDSLEKQLKPHWHICLCFPSLKSFSQVQRISLQNGGTNPQPCFSVLGSYEYFTHKNCPDKEQFNLENTLLGSFSPASYSRDSGASKLEEVSRLVLEKGITEFSALVAFCLDEPRLDLLDWVSTHSSYVNTLICSIRYLKSDIYAQRLQKNQRLRLSGFDTCNVDFDS